MKEIQLEILQASYWEHFKYLKDMSLIYPPEYHKRRNVENTLNSLLDKINEIKNDSLHTIKY